VSLCGVRVEGACACEENNSETSEQPLRASTFRGETLYQI